jgi:hypothetical protein
MQPTKVSCQIAIMTGDVERILSTDCSSQDRSRLRSTSKIALIDLCAGIAESFLMFQSDVCCHPRVVLRQPSEESAADCDSFTSLELSRVGLLTGRV